MLRRCSFCARHTEQIFAQSAYSSNVFKPVACTSRHGFPGRPRSQQRLVRDSISGTRSFSTTSTAMQMQLEERCASNPEGPPSLSSALWKGKARAIELPVSKRVPIDRAVEYAAKSLHQPDPSGPAATTAQSSSQASSSSKKTDIDDAEEAVFADQLRTSLEAANALASLFTITNRTVHRFCMGRPVNTAQVGNDVSDIHAQCFSDASLEGLDLPTRNSMLSGESISATHLVRRLVLALVHLTFKQKEYRARRLQLLATLKKVKAAFFSKHPEVLVSICEDILRIIWRLHRPQSVLAMGAQFRDLLEGWTLRLLRTYLRAAIVLDQTSLAPQLREFSADLLPLSDVTCALLIKAHLLNRNLPAAQEFLQSRSSKGLPISQDIRVALLEGYRSLRHTEHLKRLISGDLGIDLGTKASTSLLNAIISVQIANGDLPAACRTFEHFNYKTPTKFEQANLDSPSLPVTVNAKSHRPSTSISSGAASKSKPNADTFAFFVRGYADLGDFDQALDYYSRMLEDGCTPTPFMSSAITCAYIKAGRARDVLSLQSLEGLNLHGTHGEPNATDVPLSRILSGSKRAEAKPDRLRPSILPSLLQKEGLRAFREAVNTMTVQGTGVTGQAVNAYLSYLTKSGVVGSERLAAIITELQAGGWQPSMVTLNILLNSVIKRSEQKTRIPARPGAERLYQKGSDQATELLASLSTVLQEKGVSIDSYTTSMIMHRFAEKGGSPNVLWQFFRQYVLNSGFHPAPHHVSALMTAYIQDGDPIGARRAMERVAVLGVQPNVHHWTLLIVDALRRDRKFIADTLLRQMQEQNVQPDLHLYTAMANWAARHGLLPDVQRILHKVRDEMPDLQWPNAVLQTILFKTRLTRREFYEAQCDLQQSLCDGLKPDRWLYRIVAESARNVDRRARELARSGKDMRDITRAVVLGKENVRIMARTMRKAMSPDHISPTMLATAKEIKHTSDELIANMDH